MASIKVKPREVERLRPSVGSRPASDTDDTLWEELLQGPDSASTASSDSEANGRYNTGMPLPQTTTLSSDDESLQQGITGVRPTKILNISIQIFKKFSESTSCWYIFFIDVKHSLGVQLYLINAIISSPNQSKFHIGLHVDWYVH